MVAAYFPDIYSFIAYNADPGDPQAVPYWVTAPTWVGVDEISEGKQYELGQTRAEDSKFIYRDVDEYLNPVNTSSPYYPFAQPYRRSMHQAVWSKGSTGNLLNLLNWEVPADTSFESYAVGTLPSWVTLTTVNALVSTNNPFQGTKCLEGATTTATNRQGIQFEVDCVPGQQYTTSAYVRQAVANTQLIRISDQVLTTDQFSRNTASGWGTPSNVSLGLAWTFSGGAAGDRSTTAATPYADGYASMSQGSVNVARYALQAHSTRDVRQRVRFGVPAVATGGYISQGFVVRYTDASNHYYIELRYNTDSSVTLRAVSRVAGVDTQVATATLDGVRYTTSDQFYVDVWLTASVLRVAAWRMGDITPDIVDGTSPDWNITYTSATTIAGTGQTGLRFMLESTNTNALPVVATCYNYSAVGSIEGTSTSATGAYNRVSVTYTATAPRHTITVATTFVAGLAGAVYYDAIMHNTGAAAGAYTTTGSTIYPVTAPYIERLPREWDLAGFEGWCAAGCVDGLAAWSSIGLSTEYEYAVRQLHPDYYYPLTGGANSTVFPDTSGNVNPPLILDISKYGLGTLPAGGSALDIPGGPGLTGVEFFPPSPPTGTKLAGTALGVGKRTGEPTSGQFVVPASLTGVGGIWRMTACCWVKVADSAAGQTALFASRIVNATNGYGYVPIQLNLVGSTVYTNYSPAAGTTYSLLSGSGLSGINIEDGQPHLLMGIVVQDTAGDTIVYRYIDDQLDGVATATTASLGGPLGAQSDSLGVGCINDGYQFAAIVDGTIGQVAIWNRELDPSETLNLYYAGHTAFAGETSCNRIARHAKLAGYVGATRIPQVDIVAVGDPITTMQAPSWSGKMDLLTDSQNTAVAEIGTLWAEADGAIAFQLRETRYLALTPSFTLGEDTAAGEYPYLDVAFDYDPTFVYADVTVDRFGGAVVTGGYARDIARARARLFGRTFTASGDFERDGQAQDYADWVFYSHNAPNLRVEEVTLDPVSYPALWPLALGLRIGQRVRVKRRAKAANGGAGLTMSADYFVETRRLRDINFQHGTWKLSVVLSPIGAAPGPTFQPWVLEDSTLGVLGTTTVLGF